MPTDKPKNVISISDLEYEANPDPVKVPLKDGKFITFPDVFDMPIEDAEGFFRDLYKGQQSNQLTPALKRWLSEDDYKALVGQFPTFRALSPVIERVMARYEESWGSPGEGPASES